MQPTPATRHMASTNSAANADDQHAADALARMAEDHSDQSTLVRNPVFIVFSIVSRTQLNLLVSKHKTDMTKLELLTSALSYLPIKDLT